MSHMSNQEKAIYAILADNVYWDVRYGKDKVSTDYSQSNWTPVPSDWKLIKEMSGSGDVGRASNPNLAGFTACAYKDSNFN